MKRAAPFFLFVVLLAVCWRIGAQTAARVRMKDFQTHSADPAGKKKFFLKGDDAEPQTNDVIKITRPRVDTFKDDGTVNLRVDAAEAFFHSRSNTIWSAKELSVKSADEKMSIKGVGFGWDPTASKLSISNRVEATLRREAFATNQSGTNVIHIASDWFSHTAALVQFGGNVRVTDADGNVRAELLKVFFDQANDVREIEAIGSVFLTQGKTEAEGARAVFERQRGILRLFEKTKWRQENRRGESEALVLDRQRNTLRAERNVRMTLPSSLISTNAPSDKPGEVVITAETFDYDATNSVSAGAVAVFNGNVKAREPQANLDCALLTIFFDKTNKVERAIADRDVVITSQQAEVKGTRAVFEKEEITIAGPPTWTMEKRTGSSELLVLNTRTREIRALTNVAMRIPAASLPSSILAPASATNTAPRNTELLVTANSFRHWTNIALFEGSVRAQEERGQIDANQIQLLIGASNRVERITATKDVIITHDQTQAIGQFADYDLVTQTIRLTGKPKAWTEDREIDAREFLIDRNTGQFKALPPYKIKLKRSAKAETALRSAP